MKIKILSINFALFALPILLGFSAPSIAVDNNNGPSKTTKSDLINGGYTCERVATNFTECKKPGGRSYWCTDDGTCEPAPFGATAPGSGVITPVNPSGGNSNKPSLVVPNYILENHSN